MELHMFFKETGDVVEAVIVLVPSHILNPELAAISCLDEMLDMQLAMMRIGGSNFNKERYLVELLTEHQLGGIPLFPEFIGIEEFAEDLLAPH